MHTYAQHKLCKEAKGSGQSLYSEVKRGDGSIRHDLDYRDTKLSWSTTFVFVFSVKHKFHFWLARRVIISTMGESSNGLVSIMRETHCEQAPSAEDCDM